MTSASGHISGTAASGPREFNYAVHGLRGLAAMMVFLAHILNGLREHAYGDRTAFVDASEPFWNLGTYGVYLFFTISGFVILPSVMRYSLKEFASRRFFRIYPLFLFMTIVFIVLNAITKQMPEQNDLFAIIVALTFMDLFTATEQLAPNAWSLTFEAFFYALTCFVVLFTIKSPNRILGALAILAAVAFALAYPVTIYFVIGLLVRMAYDRGFIPPVGVSRAAEAAAFAGLLFIASQGHFAYVYEELVNPIAWTTILATGVYFLFAVRSSSLTSRIMTLRPLLYIGTVSYSLYLVHPYTYLSMRLVFQKLGLFTDNVLASGLLFYPAVIIPTLIATHFVHVWVETWPYNAVFKRRVFAPETRRDSGQTVPVEGTASDAIAALAPKASV